jgi:hypothetical protein
MRGQEIVLFFQMSRLALGSSHHPIQWEPGNTFPVVVGGYWPGYEVDHSSLSKAEVKNKWYCTSTAPVCLHNVERGNFTFTLLLMSSKAGDYLYSPLCFQCPAYTQSETKCVLSTNYPFCISQALYSIM